MNLRNIKLHFIRRKNKTKYVQWIEVEADLDYTIEEYYDLANDLMEIVNLMDSANYQEAIKKERRTFLDWRTANPSSFKFDEYVHRAQFGCPNVDWDSIKVIRPDRYEKVKAEIERLGIDWETAMTDWKYRYEISKNTQYWY